jgi:hypothetical protein
VWKHIKDAVDVCILGVEAWREEGWEACLPILMERPRRRPLQRVPDEGIDVYHSRSINNHKDLREAA